MSERETLLEGVEIRILQSVNPGDKRGQTIEWHKGEYCMQITKCFRGKGCVAGNHYHRGDDPSKAPERFSLNYGKLDLIVCDGAHFKERHFDIPWDGACAPRYEITINPCILHALLFHTAGGFDEWRTTQYCESHSDTYAPETFEQYLLKQYKPVMRNMLDDFAERCARFPASVGSEAGA